MRLRTCGAPHLPAARHRDGETILSPPLQYPERKPKLAIATSFAPADFECSPAACGRPLAIAAATMLALAGLAIAPATLARDGDIAGHWSGTWAASPQVAAVPTEFSGQTIRQVVHASIGGTQVRVRLSNAYGASPLHIGAARVGLRSTGASIAAGSNRVLTFNGSVSTTIPVGALAVSDPVDLRVPDRADLAISLWIPGTQSAATEHKLGLQTTYVSPEGDFSGADTLPTATTTTSYYYLAGVDVGSRAPSVAIVALGDSITDGLHSTPDANRRWTNRLAERLRAHNGGNRIAVLNAGISGNRILHDKAGTNASARLDRDVLVQPGVRYLIVLEGINDIGIPVGSTAEDIIAGHRQIIERARAMGIKVYGGTLTPFQAFLPGVYYSTEGEAKRLAVNQWIRTGKAYDAVIDFDRALRDPANPAVMRPAYDSGDHLHPNDAGYQAMADAVDLSLFNLRAGGRQATSAKGASLPVGKPIAPTCRCPP
jgi:lysophospholipase L1-like esterase